MLDLHTPQSQPQAAHAQPVDPVVDTLQGAGVDAPAAGSDCLQEVLPEIKDLAQKVGGMKHLADIAETLEQEEG
jgi:hypothetical protein